MDRRTLLTVALCFGIFALWQKYYIEPRIHPSLNSAVNSAVNSTADSATSSAVNTTPQAPSQSAGQMQATQAGIVSPETAAATPSHPQQTRTLTTNKGLVTVGDGRDFLTDWTLKGFRQGLQTQDAAVDIQSVTRQNAQIELAFEDQSLSYLNSVQGTFTDSPGGVTWSYEDHNIKMTRQFSTNEALPYLNVLLNIEFKAKHPSFAFLSVSSQGEEKDAQAQDRQLYYFTNQSLERVRDKDFKEIKEVPTDVRYIGAANRYFTLALVPEGLVAARGLLQPLGLYQGRLSLVFPVSSNSFSLPFKAYFGPKELGLLRSVDPTLDHVVDFGWFTFFAYPILGVLKWLYSFVGNYGIAIILLTVLLKLVTYPLTYKSMKSMREMAKLQPQLQKLRDKHKDDREALNREMLVMMRSHGYNPAAGCVPMLITMPVFFALYRVLYSSFELYQAPFGLWIHDLSSKDAFYITPVLLSLTMYIQQRLTPSAATDPMQAKMMQFMPLMFGAFMLGLPAGLTIYMLTNAIAGIAQQLIINKKLGPAAVTVLPAQAR